MSSSFQHIELILFQRVFDIDKGGIKIGFVVSPFFYFLFFFFLNFWDDQFAALWVFRPVRSPTLSRLTKPTTPFQSTSTLTSSVKRSKVDPTVIVTMPSGTSTRGLKCSWPVLIFRTDTEAGSASTPHPNSNLATTPVT